MASHILRHQYMGQFQLSGAQFPTLGPLLHVSPLFLSYLLQIKVTSVNLVRLKHADFGDT